MLDRRQVLAVLAASSVLSGACSGIRRYTYEIELTTDPDEHRVELWYDQGDGEGEKVTYALNLRQSYYAYRDNHEAEKQTTIGLLLDVKTFKPLTELISAETGVREALATPRSKEGALKKLAFGSYRSRQLFVTITGRTAPPPITRSNPAKGCGEMYESRGIKDGFAVCEVPHSPGYIDNGLPELVGYDDTTNNRIRFNCLAAVAECSMSMPYRASTISFGFSRGKLAASRTLMFSVEQLLEKNQPVEGRR